MLHPAWVSLVLEHNFLPLAYQSTQFQIQAYLGETVGCIPEHHNKANITVESDELSGFPVHIKVTFTL